MVDGCNGNKKGLWFASSRQGLRIGQWKVIVYICVVHMPHLPHCLVAVGYLVERTVVLSDGLRVVGKVGVERLRKHGRDRGDAQLVRRRGERGQLMCMYACIGIVAEAENESDKAEAYVRLCIIVRIRVCVCVYCCDCSISIINSGHLSLLVLACMNLCMCTNIQNCKRKCVHQLM